MTNQKTILVTGSSKGIGRAIAVDAAGQSHILLQQGDSFVQLPIRQLGCVTGMCAIESTQASTPLSAGLNVRVDR